MKQRFNITLTALGFALFCSTTTVAKPVPTSCGATDLLKATAKNEPAAYAKIVAAAKAVPNGDGLLWRIEKAGVQPSYLFGTMHSTDPRLDRHTNRIRPLIARSKSVAVEIGELMTPGLRDKASLEIARAGLARSGNALDALHPIQNRALVETALIERGVPLERAQRLETWFLIVALSTPPCERQRRARGLISMDEKIGVAGVKAGKMPIGLEKLEDQIAVMRNIGGINPPIALIETVRDAKLSTDMRETMTQAYIGDRVGELWALSRLREVLSGEAENSATRNYTRALLDDRNVVMRDNSKALIDKGGAFIAVGALHLPGEMGLVSLYRQLGYKVSVVK
ncbi:MAG: TraB/GumN family protein [Beijerinckiaceae bacterium]